MIVRLTSAAVAFILAGCAQTTVKTADGTEVTMRGDLGYYPTQGGSAASSGSTGLFGGLFNSNSNLALSGVEANAPSSFEVYGANGQPVVRVRGVYGHSTQTAVFMHASWKMLRSALTAYTIGRGIEAWEATKIADKAVDTAALQAEADTAQVVSADAVAIAKEEADAAIAVASAQ